MIDFNRKLALPDAPDDVLTVGELLIDMIADEYEGMNPSGPLSNAYHSFFGGSPANIAMNLRRLGARSRIASAVGKDRFGDFLLERLQQEGVDTSLIRRTERSTSLVVVTKSRHTPVPIFYRGADYELSYGSDLEQAVADTKIVHFSCWPASGLPVRDTLEQVIAAARKHGRLIGFDPNYHPAIWQCAEPGIDYVKMLIGQADIVKPSEDDAERLFGPASPEVQLERFLRLGAKLVVLTLGRYGAMASNGSELLRFPTLATEVCDATGAGDAFWSGCYAALTAGSPVREALEVGFAVSAYKLRHVGAVVKLPDLDTLRHLYGV